MRECRSFPWCSYIEDHGCTKDLCRHYQPMPDVEALLALADELCDGYPYGLSHGGLEQLARRIREALGVVA